VELELEVSITARIPLVALEFDEALGLADRRGRALGRAIADVAVRTASGAGPRPT
jgi:hypothetical protein